MLIKNITDINYRRKWDTILHNFESVEKDTEKEEETIYYIFKGPIGI